MRKERHENHDLNPTYQELVHVSALCKSFVESFPRSSPIFHARRPKSVKNVLRAFEQLIAQNFVGFRFPTESQPFRKVPHYCPRLDQLRVAVDEQGKLPKQQGGLVRSLVARIFELLASCV